MNQTAVLIKRHANARKLVREFRDSESREGAHTRRKYYITQLNHYTDLKGATYWQVHNAIRDAKAKEKHWSDDFSNPDRDPYTGELDDRVITLSPGQYVTFDDGEVMGYDEFRWLYEVINTTDGPYKDTEDNKRFWQANKDIGQDQEEVVYEDRGYEPPTFTPPLNMEWLNIEDYITVHNTDLDHYAQTLFDDMRVQQTRYWAQRRSRKYGYKVNPIKPHFGQLIDNNEGFIYAFSQHINPYPDQNESHQGIFEWDTPNIQGLSEAETYFVLRDITRRIIEKAQVYIADTNKPWNVSICFKYWDIVNTLVDLCQLTDFVELYFDEIHDRDTGSLKEQLSEKDIREMAWLDDFDAPIIKMDVDALTEKYRANSRQFPTKEKIRTERRNGQVYIWLNSDRDWRTLAKLYKFFNIELAQEKHIHRHTPKWNHDFLHAAINGASNPSDIAWSAYRQ